MAVLYGLWSVMALTALLAPAWLPGKLPGRHDGIRSGPAALTPVVRLELATLLLWNLGLGALWAFLDRIGRGMNLEGEIIGLALSLGLAFAVLGSAQAAWMSDRFGTRWPLWLMMVVHLSTFALLAGELPGWWFVATLAVFNYTWNLALPYLLGSIARADDTGSAAALIPAAQTAGNTLGPILGGMLAAGGGYTWVLLLPGVCYALMIAALLSLRRLQSQEAESGETSATGRTG